jgi:hypothetical protein
MLTYLRTEPYLAARLLPTANRMKQQPEEELVVAV